MTLTEARAALTETLNDDDIERKLDETIALLKAAERIRRAEMDVLIRHALLEEYKRMTAEKENP